MLDKLREIIGSKTKAIYAEARQGDIKHSYATVDKLGKYGYDPKIGFDEGLRRTVEFFRNKAARTHVS